MGGAGGRVDPGKGNPHVLLRQLWVGGAGGRVDPGNRNPHVLLLSFQTCQPPFHSSSMKT